MRRLIIFTVLAAGVFLVMRKIAERAGPAIREGCSEICERMLAKQQTYNGGEACPSIWSSLHLFSAARPPLTIK
jgi:hypothetical protein